MKSLSTLTVVCCLIVFSLISSGQIIGSGRVNIHNANPRDTIPKGKVYTLTYDRSFFYTNIDSINAIGSQYIGTELSKSSWMQIMGIYNRVLVRIVNSGKLDSVIIKK